ncbi:MAG TPA: hypothetical protein P5279_11745 [Anaerohalosphaeraceae bacterium]|jgi:hypothetical protein|nr:hypothetical protein [Anaerohalosphaeraceae bacterium]
MAVFVLLTGGLLFFVAMGAHIWVKLRMRPDSDLDDYYFELEDRHPGYVRYEKWSRITFAGAVVGALMLFLGLLF